MPKADLYILVAELAGRGLTQGMIARLLDYSRTHVMRIFRELGIAEPNRYRTAAEAFKALPPDVQVKVREARQRNAVTIDSSARSA